MGINRNDCASAGNGNGNAIEVKYVKGGMQGICTCCLNIRI